MVNFYKPVLVCLACMFYINAGNAAEQKDSVVTSENDSAFCYYKGVRYSEGAKIPELKGRVCKNPNLIIKEEDKNKLIWEVDNESKVPSRR